MHIFLETERLGLRRFTASDVDRLVDLVASPTSTKNVAVPDNSTTGILAATASQVPGTVVAGNYITGDHFGIFLEALKSALPSPVSGLSSNSFHHVFQALKEVTVS